MVFCGIVGCGRRSPRDKCSFHHLPAVIKHQGAQMLELSSERCRAWLSAISRADMTDKRLCLWVSFHGKFINNLLLCMFIIQDFFI